jgi:pimeloyl-ACP methyl ester carboxylesterase
MRPGTTAATARAATRAARFGVLVAAAWMLVACGTPVGVKRMDPTAVQRQLTRSILSSDTLSTSTQNALFQHDLTELFDTDPKAAIGALAKAVAQGNARRNDIYALAETSFAYAEDHHDPAYFRSAAVYAWLFLFPEDGHKLDPFDARTRNAADLYNRGIARGFALGPDGDFLPRAGAYPVPFGTLDVYFDESQLQWMDRKLVKFVPVAELEVEGLATRYRWSGIGAPFAASTVPINAQKGYDDHVQPWAKVGVTAVLKMDDVQQQLATGRVNAQLLLEQPLAKETVDIDGKDVPLEAETTASLAYMLAESPVWQREIGGFLQRMAAIPKGTQLASIQPYRPGRIPIVLVHGTASSPGRWAQMINELGNDRRIGPHVQFWLFTYDTGNPIGYSAMLLRESLTHLVQTLDPEGKDPALRDMVVMGHSQGGLLTKMMAIDSGDKLWKLASNTPLDQLDIDPEERERIRKIAFFKPVPNVKRVIFLATPHRGSYIAGSWLAQQVARLIAMPADLTRLSADLITRNKEKLNARFSGMGSSIAGMTPGNPAIQALSSIPIDPGVKAHSIIAVTDPDVPRDQANDGVVEYTSAHIEGVESEYVVVSGHSCQDNPHTIQEVRRILLEHIAEFDRAQGAASSPAEASQGDVSDEGANGDSLPEGGTSTTPARAP